MKPIKLMILLALLLFLTARPSCAEDEITIKGDKMTYDKADDTVRAEGNVIILHQGITVTSQSGSYNRSTGLATANGNVVIRKGQDTLRGEWATLDTVSGRGEMHNGTATRKSSNVTLLGDTIIRNGDGTLTLKTTDLTTCDIADPSWKFSSNHLDVNLEGYAVGRDIVFYIRNTPVFYMPWFAFPATEENMSGLLFPKIGNSRKRGFSFDVPFYWAISPSQDAVFDVDILSKRGVGLGVDYRYARKRGSEGELFGYLIYDRMADRWRGRLNGTHEEIISPDLNMRASINLTTDRKFRKDYGEENGDYNKHSDDTIVNALKTWQNFALTANLRYSQDYYAPNNRNTLQTLPEIGLSVVRQRLFATPVYFDLDSTVSNFDRDNGPSGRRFHAFPRLTLVTGLPGYLNATIYAGTHLRGYDTENIPAGSGTSHTASNQLPEAGATVSSSFVRIYEINGEHLKKIRHELTPEISYRYATARDQSRLPFYDYNDRLVHQNVVYYGITSHLGGRFQNGETTEYRDISTIRLMQGYSFSGERRDQLTMVDDSRHMSDAILESETWLHPRLRLLFDARYDLNDNRLSSAAPGLEYNDREDNSASVYYRMSRNRITTTNQVEYLEANLSTRYFRPWTLEYSTRYSFDRPGFLESVYSAEYRHQCWSVKFTFRDRRGNPSFTVNFNLAGLTDGGLGRSRQQ